MLGMSLGFIAAIMIELCIDLWFEGSNDSEEFSPSGIALVAVTLILIFIRI